MYLSKKTKSSSTPKGEVLKFSYTTGSKINYVSNIKITHNGKMKKENRNLLMEKIPIKKKIMVMNSLILLKAFIERHIFIRKLV